MIVRKFESGISTLEFAIFLIVLLPIVTGVFSLVDFTQKSTALRRALVETINDTNLKSLTYEASNGITEVKYNEIISWLNSTRDNFVHLEDIVREYGEIPVSSYYIETQIAELIVNSNSGEITDIQYDNNCCASNGFFRPTSMSLATSDLKEEVQRLVNLSTQNGASVYSVPTAFSGQSGNYQHYFNKSVLVGIRAFISLEGSFVGNTLSLIGLDPVLYDFQVIPLRGDFE